ncbi:galactosyltransferase [Lactobacillus taiwanensis]|uniref:glycosyltransferase n=1 Tax=Lactobacillus taiwanensis TaxID=508451 RepID=UPI000B986220|nr:glycosyltransferase [Lactobacillus taiwanensis]OYS18668.1 galactosyltransferase [Lactobacillus taiwanensis]OYS21352.1 galactosyltransferase [Lactobacillus taiwanensis]OYS22185.1 galactosyltransferase [Lactobacillus taiwanensis]OYS22285.1 galactosyltransferase [Lactobacillus taiwanensis]OYS27351.1 galactosyltransferase [Lactobacillus taiwanensis]
MKVLHINAGLEKGGGLSHIVNLLTEAKIENANFELLTLADGPVAQTAKKAGIKTTILGAQSRYDLSVLKRLTKFINRGNFDIVHTHGARANLFISMIKKQINAKWIITVHSDPLKDFEGRGMLGNIFTKFNILALKKADGIFAITQNFSDLLVEKIGIPKTKICVIYNGIFFHKNSELPKKYAHPYFNIINVGRTEKVKGQDLLLKAIKNLNDKNVHLHIAGDGSEFNNLRALARDLGISSQVTFHGFLTQKEITKLYQKMDLAVLTSYSESFPLVLLEASDNLVPILSTDVGDIEKMIPDKKSGFIAQIGNLNDISKKLKLAVTTNKDDLEAMAEREKEYLMHAFSMKNQLVAIENYYKLVLGENSGKLS